MASGQKAGPIKIRLQAVTRSFGAVIPVRNLTLDVDTGERIALIGPSGAGKTTLLRLINGALEPDSGTVDVDGHRWGGSRSRDRDMRSRIGVVYQHFNLVPSLSVVRNVQAGKLGQLPALLAVWKFLMPETREIAPILRKFGIEEKIHERTERISGGEQQRAAIARAMFQDPDIMLADEPIASVDPGLSQLIIDTLNAWSVEKGSTLIVSLHQVEFARNNFGRLIGLRDGKIRFDTAPSNVTAAMLEDLYEKERLVDGTG